MRSARCWLFGLALLVLACPGVHAQAVPAAGAAPVILVQIDGAIGPATADHVHRALAFAVRQHAQLLVLQIDTPGGLDASMRSIIKDILASPVPVASFVAPNGARAASAGTYMLYASHIAAMAPASNLGAATPVEIGIGGSRSPEPPAPAPPASGAASAPDHGGDPMSAKRLADASAYIRSLAQLRGRNAEWAEKAVRESVSLSAGEALKSKVIDIVATDVPDLLRQLDGRRVALASGSVQLATPGAPLVPFEADWRARLLSVITDPSLALLLMLVGIYGLLFEFSNPGFVLPGVVGGICLLLALFALQMLPVNYAGLALILLGIAFLVAEAFLPSFGALGIGGIVAFATGAVLLIDSDSPGFGIPLELIAIATAVSAVFVLMVAGMAARARRRPVVSGVSTLLGTTAEVIEFSDGKGWALVQGEHWRVRGNASFTRGERVRVVGMQGSTLDIAAETGGVAKGA
jgi:membrane-bound serine protease (ClpP class)